MSYKCGKCGVVVGPNVPMTRETEYKYTDVYGRPVKQVAKETPVCSACQKQEGRDVVLSKSI